MAPVALHRRGKFRFQPPVDEFAYGPTTGAESERTGAGPRTVTDPGGAAIDFGPVDDIHALIDANPVSSTFVGSSGAYTRTLSLSDRGRNPTVIFLPGAVLTGPGEAAGSFDAVSFTDATLRGGKWQNFTGGLAGVGANVVFEDVEATHIYNIGMGFLGSNSRASYCWLHTNGKYGCNAVRPGPSGNITNVTFDHCKVDDNNTRQLDPNGDAGSSKFLFVHGMTFSHNWFFNNYGHGPWWDTDCNDVMCEENVFEDNRNSGWFYESCQGGTTFRRNAVLRNGDTLTADGARANAQFSSVRATLNGSFAYVLVERNIFDGDGDQTSVWFHNGHVGELCDGIHITNNDIWLRANTDTRIGGSNAGGEFVGKDLTWANNRYHVTSLSASKWHWDATQFNGIKSWAQWQALGFDTDASGATRELIAA